MEEKLAHVVIKNKASVIRLISTGYQDAYLLIDKYIIDIDHFWLKKGMVEKFLALEGCEYVEKGC